MTTTSEWDRIQERMREQGQTVRRAVVVRDVAKDEPHNYLHRDVAAGEVFYDFIWNTYGCVSDFGVALSEQPGEHPFFEFPANAIQWAARQ